MIHFVEGIPGGGKSTFARELYEAALRTGSGRAVYYKEEYRNPIDFLRQAVLTEEEYDRFLEDIGNAFSADRAGEGGCEVVGSSGVIRQIRESITRMDGLVFLPFMHIETGNAAARKMLDALYEKEADDGKVPFDEYCTLLIARVEHFLSECDQETDYIFEGALLHNPLISMLCAYDDLTYLDIKHMYEKLYGLLGGLTCTTDGSGYVIDLIRTSDIDGRVRQTAANRRGAPGHGWEDGFSSLLGLSGRYAGYEGLDGIIRFVKEMAGYEERIMSDIPFNVNIIQR